MLQLQCRNNRSEECNMPLAGAFVTAARGSVLIPLSSPACDRRAGPGQRPHDQHQQLVRPKD